MPTLKDLPALLHHSLKELALLVEVAIQNGKITLSFSRNHMQATMMSILKMNNGMQGDKNVK